MADLTKLLPYSDRRIRQLLQQGTIRGGKITERGKWVVPTSEAVRFKREIGLSDKAQLEKTLESEAATDKRGLQVLVESQEDPLIVEARRKHFLDRQNTGKALIAWLDEFVELSDAGGMYIGMCEIDTEELTHLMQTLAQLNKDPLLECLERHTPSSLWESYRRLGDDLWEWFHILSEMERAANYQEKIEILNRRKPGIAWVSSRSYEFQIWEALDESWLPLWEFFIQLKRHVTLAISQGVFPRNMPSMPY